MNITYDFHGALSRVGTLPADVKAGKEPPADYSGESTAAFLSLFFPLLLLCDGIAPVL